MRRCIEFDYCVKREKMHFDEIEATINFPKKYHSFWAPRPQSIFIKKVPLFLGQTKIKTKLNLEKTLIFFCSGERSSHLTVLNMLLIWFSGQAWSLPLPSRLLLLCTFMANAIRHNILIQPHTRSPNAHPFGTTQSLRPPASFVATNLDCKIQKDIELWHISDWKIDINKLLNPMQPSFYTKLVNFLGCWKHG